jgi:hypothetical protein
MRWSGTAAAEVVDAVVPTVTVTGWAVVPLICTEELESAQVGAGVAAGVMAHARLTVPEKVAVGVSDKVKVAFCPGVIDWELELLPIVKSGGAGGA